jgi:hypothetical protein
VGFHFVHGHKRVQRGNSIGLHCQVRIIKSCLKSCHVNYFFSIHHNTHSKTVKLWEDFLSLYRFITHDEETKTIEFVFSKCKEWVNSFLDLGSMRQGYQNITPYLHCLVYHIPYFVVTYGKLVNYSGQGIEKINDDIKKNSSIKYL